MVLNRRSLNHFSLYRAEQLFGYEMRDVQPNDQAFVGEANNPAALSL